MLTIKSLSEDTVKDVAELERECFGADAWSENLLRNEIGQSDKYYFLLYDDDILVAYGGFMKIFDEGDIMNIAVSGNSRRKGYGTKILEEFFKKAKDIGILRFTLEVRQSNFPARSLYEKVGFVLSGERRNYYSNKESCCIYWKVIAEEAF